MGDREGEKIKRAGKGSSRDNWRHLRPPPFAPTRRRAWQHKLLVTGTGVGGGDEGFRSNKYVYRVQDKRRHPLHPRGSTRMNAPRTEGAAALTDPSLPTANPTPPRIGEVIVFFL